MLLGRIRPQPDRHLSIAAVIRQTGSFRNLPDAARERSLSSYAEWRQENRYISDFSHSSTNLRTNASASAVDMGWPDFGWRIVACLAQLPDTVLL